MSIVLDGVGTPMIGGRYGGSISVDGTSLPSENGNNAAFVARISP
jgi:hypothetical protein